jgi:CO dehydrogenase maturation factor
LFTRFHLTALVCEPTLRSVAVYRQYQGYAQDYGVRIAVIGNKVCDDDDLAFLRDEVGASLLCWIGRSQHVRAAERGHIRPIGELEPDNIDALATLRATVDATTRDWVAYQRQAVEFHVRNATAWANDRTGQDLVAQVDPDFVPGPVFGQGSLV